MDYLLRYTDLPKLHIIIALLLILGVWILKRDWLGTCAGVLAGWLFLTLSVTLLSRTPFEGNHALLSPFCSYRLHSAEALKENILNVFLLMPVGTLFPIIINTKHKSGITIGAGFLWRLMIESLQYFTKRGYFEIDDLIHNTVGVVIGYLIFKGLKSVWKKTRRGRGAY